MSNAETRKKADISAQDWRNPFIRAGYDSPAFIKEKPGVYPEVFFRYQRLSPRDVERTLTGFRNTGTDPEMVMEFVENVVTAQLRSWSFGALNPGLIRELCHPLLNKIFWIICQTEGGDPIPEEYLPKGERATAEDEQKKS